MTFPLFSLPKCWTTWLIYAIYAEEICEKKGMKREEARSYLLLQDPKRVIDFVRTFKFEDHGRKVSDYRHPFSENLIHFQMGYGNFWIRGAKAFGQSHR